jgi:hypothetical protein
VIDVRFAGTTIEFSTPDGQYTVLIDARFGELHIKELDLKLMGLTADLARIADDLLNGRVTADELEFFKKVSKLEPDDQAEVLKKYAEAGFADAVQFYEKIKQYTERYSEFIDRGYVYLPNSEQLILSTGIVIQFQGSGVVVRWSDIARESVNEAILNGAIQVFSSYHTLDEDDARLIEKAARELNLPQPKTRLLENLRLVAITFPGRSGKQHTYQSMLKCAPFPAHVEQSLKKHLHRLETDRARRLAYSNAFDTICEKKYKFNPETKELLYRSGWVNWYLFKFTDDDVQVFRVEFSESNTTYIIGRWALKGKWPRSQYLHFVSGVEDALNESDIEKLVDISSQLPSPYQEILQSKLLAKALSRRQDS